jgi:flagellar basal-body rod modification protein FlgD
MDIGATPPIASGPPTDARLSLADDFDSFLKLLTTQLANQDPLDPVDSNEFVAQIVSFTGVEQAVGTNSKLERLIGLFSINQTAAALGFLGTTVEANGDTTTLSNGSAAFYYNLAATAARTSIVIRDAEGNTVYTGNGETAAGEHTFVWDGRDTNGTPQPDGRYSIAVTARDASDGVVAVDTRIVGRVTGVDTEGGDIVLTVNGVTVPYENVLSIREGDPPPPA